MNYRAHKPYRDPRRSYRGGSTLALVLPGRPAAKSALQRQQQGPRPRTVSALAGKQLNT